MNASDTSTAPGVGAADADEHARLLYRLHGRAVLGYVTRILRDQGLAEDVVQETMLRAWRTAETLDPDTGATRRWLTRVAHNIAIDKLRARKARPTEVAAEAAHPETGDHADQVLDAMQVAQALALLSPGHRAVLRELYLNGRTVAEAAVVLNLPAGTIKSRTYYALRALREAMPR